MAWISLGQVAVASSGTRVRLTANATNPAARVGCEAILVQAISDANHTNTGRVYLFAGPTDAAPVATLAVPTTNTIPSAAATIPNAPGGLNAADFWIDSDNTNDGVNGSYLSP